MERICVNYAGIEGKVCVTGMLGMHDCMSSGPGLEASVIIHSTVEEGMDVGVSYIEQLP
jgi:hypothetical protein